MKRSSNWQAALAYSSRSVQLWPTPLRLPGVRMSFSYWLISGVRKPWGAQAILMRERRTSIAWRHKA